jgi:hypothetical protein
VSLIVELLREGATRLLFKVSAVNSWHDIFNHRSRKEDGRNEKMQKPSIETKKSSMKSWTGDERSSVRNPKENEQMNRLFFRKKRLLSLAVLGATFLIVGAAEAVDTNRYAIGIKNWRFGDVSTCCPSCSPEVARGTVEGWLDEVVSHAEWSNAGLYDYASYAHYFYESSEISGGWDHYDQGIDNADAVMIGLHGNIANHNGAGTYRARVFTKLSSEDNGEFCKAWQDYYDLGDDNNLRDLEWLHLVTCHGADDVLFNSTAGYRKWHVAFDGLHSISSYAGESVTNETVGRNIAEDVFDNIEDSWLLNNYTTALHHCEGCDTETATARCPVWLTYHEDVDSAVALRNNDDYTTRVSEPPGHGCNNIGIRSRYSSCNSCCEVK